MTQETKNTTPSRNAPVASDEQLLVATQLSYDVKNAVLIVSAVVNLIILTAWIAMQVTSQYDAQLASLLFNR
jgi:hypothetical protein